MMSKSKKNARYERQIHLVNKWSKKWQSDRKTFQRETQRLTDYYSLPKYHGTEFRGIKRWLPKKGTKAGKDNK